MTVNLKEIRQRKLMTQTELASKAGVTRQTIVAVENGRDQNLRVQTLLALADALDVSLDALLSH